MDSLEEIKQKIDIVSLISEYVQLKRAGRNFKALCPFHQERTPSFVVSPELQIWHCFGTCSEGGDVFKFLMKIEGMEFGEAVRFLAQRAGVKLTPRFGPPQGEKEQLYKVNAAAAAFYHYLLTRHSVGSAALSYLKKERGLRDDTLARFELGFSPDKPDAIAQFLVEKKGYKREDVQRVGLVVQGEKGLVDRFRGRIVFPLKNERGNVVGFSGRVLPKDEGKNLAKYVNSPETPVYQKRRHLFGLDVTREAIKKEGFALLVEGEFDLLSCWQAGMHNVVAIKGTAFTEEQARLLTRFTTEAVLALDNDSAGDEATTLGIERALESGLTVRVTTLGAFKDPDEAVRADPARFMQKVKNAVGAYEFFIERAFAHFNPREGSGVAAISRELVPLLARIPDAILQAHYIRLVADKLRLSEDAVASQVEKVRAKEPVRAAQPKSTETLPVKPRRELVEEQLVSLALQTNARFLTGEEMEGLLRMTVIVRIQEELKKFLAQSRKFSPRLFIESLPHELTESAASLLLAQLSPQEVSSAPRELERLRAQLVAADLSTQIEEITQKIKAQEEKDADVRLEQEELARLIAHLGALKRA